MPGMKHSQTAAEPDFSVICRRNDSIGRRSRWAVFASLCALSSAMAVVFAALGAWLIIPYSVLEMCTVFWAFRWFERRAAGWEQLTVVGDRVIVDSERAGIRTTRQFNRPWVRVEFAKLGRESSPSLGLRYAGQLLRFGDDLRRRSEQRSRGICGACWAGHFRPRAVR